MGSSRGTVARRAAACAVVCLVLAQLAAAAELVHADGRREEVEELRRSSDGRFTYAREGRRVAVRPGEVAVIVDDEGNAVETIPAPADREPRPEEAAALAQAGDPRNESWREAAALLGSEPCRGTVDAARLLAGHRDKAVRLRGVEVLVALRTRESLALAARAVVAERDVRTRRLAASALFAGQEILRRAGCADVVAKGLDDADRDVRVSFALLSAGDGSARAREVLRKDGLLHPDHHFVESSARALAAAGDAAGERVLVHMLARDRLPGFRSGEEGEMLPLLVREQVDVCGLLAKLRTDAGRQALEAATRSPHAEVRAAAERALAAWEAE